MIGRPIARLQINLLAAAIGLAASLGLIIGMRTFPSLTPIFLQRDIVVKWVSAGARPGEVWFKSQTAWVPPDQPLTGRAVGHSSPDDDSNEVGRADGR
jgi:hypothetical protein